jgi:hypothetical protein
MNYFTPAEVDKMQSLLKQLQPATVASIQTYYKERTISVCHTYGVANTKHQYTYIFQYLDNLTPFRQKLLNKKAQKINYKLNVVTISDKVVCVGWKATERLG